MSSSLRAASPLGMRMPSQVSAFYFLDFMDGLWFAYDSSRFPCHCASVSPAVMCVGTLPDQNT